MFTPARDILVGDKIVHPGRYATSGIPEDKDCWTVVVTDVEKPELYDGEKVEITYCEVYAGSSGHILTLDCEEEIEVLNA